MDRKLVPALLVALLLPALILVLAGDVTWPEGWIFSVWLLILWFSVILYVGRIDPATTAGSSVKAGPRPERPSDRAVVYGLLVGFILWIVVMPLDAKWFAWSPPTPLLQKMIGGAGLIASFLLFVHSYTDTAIRKRGIVTGNGKEPPVRSTGVYGVIRHPLYLGAILMLFSAPLLLGSLGGVIIGCALTILIMARIMAEEAMQARELAGYPEYMQQVRYRLIPGIW